METFFKLPSAAPANIAIKFGIVAVACLLLWWLVTFLLLRIRGKHAGDLKFSIRSFWAAVIVFPLLQIYAFLELNYNLGELGLGAMRRLNFYLAFIPEYLASVALIGYILHKRKSILGSVNLKSLRVED